MNKNFEIEVTGLGNNTTGYPGAFTDPVNQIIKWILSQYESPKALHLFSGQSMMGEERIDIDRPEATKRMDVMDFIKSDNRNWDFIILDPPYEIQRKSKISEYTKTSSVTADVELRNALSDYFYHHTKNLIWLDICAPLPKGFQRKKLWFMFPGGYHTIRILSWLQAISKLQESIL